MPTMLLLNKRLGCGGFPVPLQVGGDPTRLIETLLIEEAVFSSLNAENFVHRSLEALNLDPGGMISVNSKVSQVVAGDVPYHFYSSKIGVIVDRLYQVKDRGEKITGFYMYPADKWNVFIPTDELEGLIEVLLGESTDPEVQAEEQRLKDSLGRLRDDGHLADPDSCPGL